MRCAECDHVPEVAEEPNYCPVCGERGRQKTIDDVDWPLEVTATTSVNLYRHVRAATRYDDWIEALRFEDEADVRLCVTIYRDCSFEVEDAVPSGDLPRIPLTGVGPSRSQHSHPRLGAA